MLDIDIADAINWDHSLNNGLVEWWMSLPGQQRGNIARGLAHRYDGTLVNGAEFVGARGRPGAWGSLFLDGTNDRVVVDAAIPVDGISALTVELWVYLTNVSDGNFQSFASKRMAYNSDNSWIFALNTGSGVPDDNTLNFELGDAAGTNFLPNSFDKAALTANAWHHLVATFNSAAAANVEVYIDGVAPTRVSQNDLDANLFDSSGDLLIGAGNSAAPNGHVSGFIDGVRVYNRTLSAAEVALRWIASLNLYDPTLNWIEQARYSAQEVAAGSALLLRMMGEGLYASSGGCVA